MTRLPATRSFLTPVLAILAPLPVLALAVALGGIQPAHADPAARLTVTVTGIAQHSGTLRLAVYDEAGYASDTATNGANIAVTGDTASAVIEGLAPGRYGVKMYHDVNDNGKMDTNPFGMPTEPYAFSNNARGQFGPAKWAAAAFDVGASGGVQSISLVQE